MKALRNQDVVVGKPLAMAVYDQHGVLLLERGHVVISESQRQQLLERGFSVDAEQLGRLRAAIEATQRVDGSQVTSTVRAASVIERLHQLRDRLRDLQPQILHRRAQRLPAQVFELVERLQSLTRLDPDAALAAMPLAEDALCVHGRPIHAAVLCQLMAEAAHLDEASTRSLMAAALTHDIALLPLAQTLHSHQGALPEALRAQVDGHPEAGATLLREQGVDDPTWLDIVLHHHERLDGSGYPHALQAEAIHTACRIATLVDTFCAMIRPRAYRQAVVAKQALKDLFLQRGVQVDGDLTALFIRAIGMYPPGALVRLASNEVGVVFRRTDSAAQPLVRRLLGSDGKVCLQRQRRDTSQPQHAVTDALSAEQYRALLKSLHRLWG